MVTHLVPPGNPSCCLYSDPPLVTPTDEPSLQFRRNVFFSKRRELQVGGTPTLLRTPYLHPMSAPKLPVPHTSLLSRVPKGPHIPRQPPFRVPSPLAPHKHRSCPQVQDPEVLRLLYEEAKANVLGARYPCDPEDCEALGALVCRLQLGPYQPGQPEAGALR